MNVMNVPAQTSLLTGFRNPMVSFFSKQQSTNTCLSTIWWTRLTVRVGVALTITEIVLSIDPPNTVYNSDGNPDVIACYRLFNIDLI